MVAKKTTTKVRAAIARSKLKGPGIPVSVFNGAHPPTVTPKTLRLVPISTGIGVGGASPIDVPPGKTAEVMVGKVGWLLAVAPR